MRVVYVPPGASSINDAIDLHDSMRLIMNRARIAGTARLDIARRQMGTGTCPMCGTWGKLEIHHSKPLWACALEAILNTQPKDKATLRRTVTAILDDMPPSWHDSLIAVCPSCHTQTHKRDDAFYKSAIEKRHRVIFGQRRLVDVLALIDQSNMTHMTDR